MKVKSLSYYFLIFKTNFIFKANESIGSTFNTSVKDAFLINKSALYIWTSFRIKYYK